MAGAINDEMMEIRDKKYWVLHVESNLGNNLIYPWANQHHNCGKNYIRWGVNSNLVTQRN